MRVPKYRHFKPSNIGFVEWNGKRHYFARMKYNSPESKRAYYDFLAANLKNKTKGKKGEVEAAVDPTTITLAELSDRYLSFAAGYYGTHERSEFNIYRRILLLVVERYGDIPVKEFGPRKLADLRDYLSSTDQVREYDSKSRDQKHKRSYRLHRTTINHLLGNLKRVFKWGVANEFVAPDQLAGLQAVTGIRAGRSQARESVPRQPVAWEEVERTLPKLTPTVRAMVLTQWYTGCRPEQVRLLRPREIDRSQNPWLWTPEKHKTQWRNQSLTLWIGPQAQRILAPWLDGDPNEYCFRPIRGGRPCFASDVYQKQVLRGIAALATPRVKLPYSREKFAAAGLVYWTPHQLRHARATEVREQFGLEAAQAVLGHASLAATQIYAKKRASLGREIALKTG